MAPSSGCVMKPATVCASAPKYAVLTLTTAFCVFGYWRTERLVKARTPTTRISRLTVIARTGLRMKLSVKFIAGRRSSLFLRRRIWIVRRLHGGVDDDRRAVPGPHLPTGGHLRPR